MAWWGDEKKIFIYAWRNFPEEFKDNLSKLGEMSQKAGEDLLKYLLLPPHTWCKAYFSLRSECHMVDNKMLESFNGTIFKARFKPIVSILEDMRLYVMNKIKDNMHALEKWINEWSPWSMAIF